MWERSIRNCSFEGKQTPKQHARRQSSIVDLLQGIGSAFKYFRKQSKYVQELKVKQNEKQELQSIECSENVLVNIKQESMKLSNLKRSLNQFRMGLFGAAHAWGAKAPSLPKICHTYITMMKLGRVISYLISKIKKCMNHVTHPLISTDIIIFSLKIRKSCYIKKYRYRLHFDS